MRLFQHRYMDIIALVLPSFWDIYKEVTDVHGKSLQSFCLIDAWDQEGQDKRMRDIFVAGVEWTVYILLFTDI